MDFKVGGTKKGITAIQMDLKNDGLTMEIIKEALDITYDARCEILDQIMLPVISEPRKEVSKYAPKMLTMHIDPSKIREVIGSGGKVIQKIVADTGAKIDINDDGSIFIAGVDAASCDAAKKCIDDIVFVPEIGKLYYGRVVRLMTFGAFVELAPGKDGLVHISKLADHRIEKVEDACKIGDMMWVKVTDIDEKGRVNLSHKDAMREIRAKEAAGERVMMVIGGCAIDACGEPLPAHTVERCLASDSVLLGAVGGPKWDALPGDKRPEKGLLGIRKAMGLYSNIRPAKLWRALADASPLKRELIEGGVEIVVVRELTGGIYFGKRGSFADEEMGETAWDTEQYSVKEIERITRIACELARKRSGHVISVDKANVLETSRLWRRTVHTFAQTHYPDVTVTDMLVDNAAMQIVKNPAQFDVLLTSNMFGDILSDEAAQVTGSIGMLASSSLGDTPCGLYEPIHGSAPDIAGTDAANPIATILAAAMMLRDSFGMTNEHAAVERAVEEVLGEGWRTADISSAGTHTIGCREMARRIAEHI